MRKDRQIQRNQYPAHKNCHDNKDHRARSTPSPHPAPSAHLPRKTLPPNSAWPAAHPSTRRLQSSRRRAQEKPSALPDSVRALVLRAPEFPPASHPLRCAGCSSKRLPFPSRERAAIRPAAVSIASAKNLLPGASAEYLPAAASSESRGQSGLPRDPFPSTAKAQIQQSPVRPQQRAHILRVLSDRQHEHCDRRQLRIQTVKQLREFRHHVGEQRTSP
jgi:hypothetical protein